MSRRIRFLSDQIYETEGPGKGLSFKAGTVLDAKDVGEVLGGAPVNDAYADAFLNRWVRRNVAVFVDKDAKDEVPATSEDYHSMTRAELDDLAASRGVDVSDAKNKGDVIAALELADDAR